jgi:solute carrier family 25 carnitine/acylcarnitine transporter 20/29
MIQSQAYSKKRESLVHLLAGSIAGVTNVLAGHPLDTLKIRMQMTGASFSESSKLIVGKEGPLALYKGMTSPLATVPFGKALNFFAYELGLQAMGVENNSSLSLMHASIAGCWAGCISILMATPTELVKCRLQMEGLGKRVQTTKASTLVKTIFKKEGIRGLYRGLAVTFWRDVPSYGVYFGFFQATRSYLNNLFGERRINTFVAGSVGGITSWIVAYPFDVIKTKIQTQPLKTKDVVKNIWKTEGYRGFVRGLAPCLTRAPIVSGFTLWPYEESKRFFSKYVH